MSRVVFVAMAGGLLFFASQSQDGAASVPLPRFGDEAGGARMSAGVPARGAVNVTPLTCATNDSDCDGFSDAHEEYMGTLPFQNCALTAKTDDESLDAFPFDFNDDQISDLSDVLKYGTPGVWGSHPTTTSGRRFDLVWDGQIELGDVLKYNTPGIFGSYCTPPP